MFYHTIAYNFKVKDT